MFSSLSLFLLLLARLSGFFLISPLFSGKSISKMIRLGFAFACSLLIIPPLVSKFTLTITDPLLLGGYALKEVVIGYLIGFIFSLLVEAAAFAGQLLGTVMGFSATELFSPLSSSPHPLLSRFFSLFIFTLFLTLDLHHPLLHLLYESFEVLPLNQPLVSQTILTGIIDSTYLFFYYALEFAILPLLWVLSLVGIFALISFFPMVWIGFPLQQLVGLLSIGASIGLFTPLLEHGFFQLLEVVKKCIVNY